MKKRQFAYIAKTQTSSKLSEGELRKSSAGIGRLKRTQMRCLLTDKVFQKRKPGGHFKKGFFCCGFFSHLAGGEPKKSLHERGEGRKPAHLWLGQPRLRSPITIPPFPRARCGKGRETKGGEKGRGRKRLWGRFTGLAEG